MHEKGRIYRLLRLITLLQTGRHFLAEDLARQVKVSLRTLFRDLRLIKDAGVPLVYDPRNRTHYIEQSFFLPPVNFTMAEVLALMMLVRRYSSSSTVPVLPAATSALMKIESTLPRDIQAYCGTVVDKVAARHLPMTDATRTSRAFEQLWHAAGRHETVEIAYDSYYEGKEIHTRLDPYRLMFAARGWYAVGYSHKDAEVRTFKVDRVASLRGTSARFTPDPQFSLAKYFGNAWQMIRGGCEYDVSILFSPKVAGNVEEVLWHPTQQTERLFDGSLRYRATVDGVHEIAWWVLGYGKEAIVEEPEELREIIVEHIKAMSRAYGLQKKRR